MGLMYGVGGIEPWTSVASVDSGYGVVFDDFEFLLNDVFS